MLCLIHPWIIRIGNTNTPPIGDSSSRKTGISLPDISS
jgi:hypothetical protein